MRKEKLQLNKLPILTISLTTLILGFGLFFWQCESQKAPLTQNAIPLKKYPGSIYDPPPIRSFPQDANNIQFWINTMNQPQIRAHGWDMWESINTLTPDGSPLWETWYSGHELFEMGANAKENRAGFNDYEDPAQFNHFKDSTIAIPIDAAAKPYSFNRYSYSLANVIWEKGYNQTAELDKIRQDFINNNTPIIDRKINTSVDSIDPYSFALKPIFQFINGDKPTALAYWGGHTPQTTNNLSLPIPDTWQQCVVVDPTNQLKPGTTTTMDCNGTKGEWEVVSLEDYYFQKITAAQVQAYNARFPNVGKNNRNDTTSQIEMMKTGNYALLVGMHVTGKEITNWTWQTYWWSPQADNPPYGMDRPSTIPSPWNNYVMRATYSMMIPPNNREGEAIVSFNPYIETRLNFPFTPNGKDTLQCFGAYSNCLSCHSMAVYPIEGMQYLSKGYVEQSDSFLFNNHIKTDFLWSFVTRMKENKGADK